APVQFAPETAQQRLRKSGADRRGVERVEQIANGVLIVVRAGETGGKGGSAGETLQIIHVAGDACVDEVGGAGRAETGLRTLRVPEAKLATQTGVKQRDA